jgi:cation diffusion facilitator family transporter
MASGSKTVIYAALAGNLLIAVTKFIAAVITGSSAMLSEGIHSVVDTGNQVLLLYGLHRAKQPPDELYPFGHGKEIYFWGFVVAILIFAIGAGLSIYEGIQHILEPEPMGGLLTNYIVLALAIIFESFSLYFALREFHHVKGDKGYFEAIREGKDPNTFVVLFEDLAAMLGLLVAFIGISLGHLTGSPYFDGGASIIIGLILAGVAVWLAYETKGLLIGESADTEVVQRIHKIARDAGGVMHVNEVLTMHMGPEYILVNLSAEFADNISAADIEDNIAQLDKEIKSTDPRVKRVFVEARECALASV